MNKLIVSDVVFLCECESKRTMHERIQKNLAKIRARQRRDFIYKIIGGVACVSLFVGMFLVPIILYFMFGY